MGYTKLKNSADRERNAGVGLEEAVLRFIRED